MKELQKLKKLLGKVQLVLGMMVLVVAPARTRTEELPFTVPLAGFNFSTSVSTTVKASKSERI